MRPGPATRAASFVDLNSCLPAARSGETTVLVRQRSPGVPHLPVLAAELRFRKSLLCNPCDREWPSLLNERTVEEGRKARATGTRSRAFPISPGNSPSRIASCHRRHRNHHPASFENSTFSLNPLWAGLLRPATEKHFALVQKLWTLRLPCGCLRKTLPHSIHSDENSSAQLWMSSM
jgi:hypothetical protein